MPRYRVSTATASTIYREYLVDAPSSQDAEAIILAAPYANMIGESAGDEDAEPEILGCEKV
jgi:hypothetical protein